MVEPHWVTITRTEDGCECLDKRSGTANTEVIQGESIRWHNDLGEDVTIVFERGHSPFDTDEITVPANGDSEEYTVPLNPDQSDDIKYRYKLSCAPPAAGPIIIVPKPPPPPPPGDQAK
jgi:hypothetical protein